MIRDFLRDRLSVAWLASALVLVVALLVVPNEGAGTFVLIALALPAIGLSGALRVRDGRRDRERKKAQRKRR
ncbi:MAG: hypothetical protein QOC95_695 [Thermoleophilaceae bacterium]|jgi:hypothetical protein|nr:hypothetical protein [Thermoleophilaceae bacterium]